MFRLDFFKFQLVPLCVAPTIVPHDSLPGLVGEGIIGFNKHSKLDLYGVRESEIKLSGLGRLECSTQWDHRPLVFEQV